MTLDGRPVHQTFAANATVAHAEGWAATNFQFLVSVLSPLARHCGTERDGHSDGGLDVLCRSASICKWNT
ncbi:MAG: hypothetical protein BYD32DRAFT_405547 [Podila humilis]|nr:MAG: hypothetical protein BYD32DRAFT_405547 [Podila humilis]